MTVKNISTWKLQSLNNFEVLEINMKWKSAKIIQDLKS